MAIPSSSLTGVAQRPIDFVVVDSLCPKFFPIVEDVFHKTVESVYGPKPDALRLIREGRELICEMLIENDVPKGLIIYKRALDSQSSLDLRSFVLLDPARDVEKMFDLQMLKHVEAVARARFAQTILMCTVSQISSDFFQRFGFIVERQGPISGVSASKIEYVLRKNLGSTKAGGSPPEKRRCLEKDRPGASAEKPVEEVGPRRAFVAGPHREIDRTEMSVREPLSSSAHREPQRDRAGASAGKPLEATGPHRERDRAPTSVVEAFSRPAHPEPQRTVGLAERPAMASSSIERCSLRREFVEQIRSGTKTYEGRVWSGPFRNYREGMRLCWFSGESEILTKIISVNRFDSFEQMVTEIGYKKLLPRSRSEADAIGEYHKIPGYTEKARQYGVVAFQVEVVKPQLGAPVVGIKRDRE